MSAKKSRSNKKQIKVLVDFMSTHDHLATGEFTGPLGSKRAQAQWQVLKEILKEHGPDRSIEQWKQTWKDLKKQARAEKAASARAHQATGNKGAIPIVSEIGTKILDTIGHECSIGIGPEESQIGSTEEIIEMCVVDGEYINSPESFVLPSPPMGFGNDQENIPPVTTITTNFTHTTRTNSRARRSHAEDFSRLQEENNSILQGIASSLMDRNQLQREHNSLLREQNSHLAEANRLKRMKR